MRTVQRTVYTARELKDAHPRGFERALQRHRQWVYDDPAWADEHAESVKDALAAMGDDPPDFGSTTTRAQDIRRSMAWVENNVLAPLRTPFRAGRIRHAQQSKNDAVRNALRWHKPGEVTSCPWTGYCRDEDLLDFIRKEARGGSSPKDIKRRLIGHADRLWEDEVEDQCREDAFLDDADANGREFYADGSLA
jgi:hypothetical protein